MRPRVSPELRKEVSSFVRTHDLQRGSRWTWRRSPPGFESVLPDVQHFHSQTTQLELRSVPQYAVSFKDDGPDGELLLVLVQVPDLHSVKASYDLLLETLRKSNLPLEKVTPRDAEEIFVDRLSEFLAVQSISLAPSTATVVNSNRNGDTVIYAKGYFTSTGTALGVSTPAVGYLSSGRYSFGIIDSGNPRFENIVWTCPADVQLNLP
jgi:hypothetical protein